MDVDPHPEHGERRGQPDRASDEFDARAFTLLVVAMALAGFAVHAVIINLVPLLTSNGLTTAQAATALAVGGVGQVVGRLFYGTVFSRLGPTARTIGTVAGVVVTTGALAVWQSPLVFVCVLTFASGTVRGIYTLIQATAVVDRWGVGDIGHLNGILTGAITATSAFAPWVGALSLPCSGRTTPRSRCLRVWRRCRCSSCLAPAGHAGSAEAVEPEDGPSLGPVSRRRRPTSLSGRRASHLCAQVSGESDLRACRDSNPKPSDP